MFQKSNEKMWADEAGMEIPYARTTAYERLCEKKTAGIIKGAEKLSGQMKAFKEEVVAAAQQLYDAFLNENQADKIGQGKGNATFYNFDRSVKIEVQINAQITFDDNLIGLAKEKLDEFIESNITGVESFIKDLVMEAFATSRGKLDTKKVLSLKKHTARIKDGRYHEAMALIDKSIRKPDSKTYFRCAVKGEAGNYKYIDLNFSSI